jgi:2-polyprenyl-3-methyl-5-hydroxy-6-metoxy-1,4-benzoquinol methylase
MDKRLIIKSSAPQITGLVSQLPTSKQMKSEVYRQWLDAMREQNRFHRKQWEYVYILQALEEHNLLREGVSGVGFGVGSEPLPAVMADRGCKVLATEINIEKPNVKGWVKDRSIESQLEALNNRDICDKDRFAELVTFRDVDMNNIPSDITGFDFTWSACSLEHLGTLKHGESFIFNSLDCLKPGGLAVHTTEYTFARKRTVEAGSSVYYRKSDIVSLAERLRKDGHEITLNFRAGRSLLDWYVDFPSHRDTKQVKLLVSKQWKLLLTTSIGMIIRKSPAGA